MMDAEHRFRLRVYYEDTDMGGLVYHANYLKFIERARSDWVRGLGVDQWALRAGSAVFAVRRIAADFLAPARFDEELEVVTRMAELGRARAVLDQEVRRGPTVLFLARVTLVCIDMATGRPQRLPAELRRGSA